MPEYAVDDRQIRTTIVADLAAAQTLAVSWSVADPWNFVAITSLDGAVVDVYRSGLSMGITAYPAGWDLDPGTRQATWPVLVNGEYHGEDEATDTLTIPVTVPAGTNVAMVVFVASNTADPSGVTYNGAGITADGSFSNSTQRVAVFKKLAPASGSHDVVISFAAVQKVRASVFVLTQCDGTDPFGTLSGDAGILGDPIIVYSSGGPGGLLLGAIAIANLGGYSPADAGQTDYFLSTGSDPGLVTSGRPVGAVGVTMGWNGTGGRIAYAYYQIKAAA